LLAKRLQDPQRQDHVKLLNHDWWERYLAEQGV
jgi:hypothetical protein